MKSGKEDGKDSAYYESSQDRSSRLPEQYADIGATSSDEASIRQLLHDNKMLEYQNQLLQNKLYLTKQNCTLKQLNLIATIVSWFDEDTHVDVNNTKQISQLQDIEERVKQNKIRETFQTVSTSEHIQHDYTKASEPFNKSENVQAVISGSKVVADLRNNVTTLGNILKGLEDASRGESQMCDQHSAAASSVGVQQLQRDPDGQKCPGTSELSRTQKDKIVQLMESTKQTMLKTIVKGDTASENLTIGFNKTSHDNPYETQRTTFEQSEASTYQNSKKSSVHVENKGDTNKLSQTTKGTDNEETVLAGSEVTSKKHDVLLGKRSFLLTKLSDDDVVSAKKYAEEPLISSTAKDDSVFVFSDEKPVLSSTAKDGSIFVFGEAKPTLSSTAMEGPVFICEEKQTGKNENMASTNNANTDGKLGNKQDATQNLDAKTFDEQSIFNKDKMKQGIPIITNTIKDVVPGNEKHSSTTLSKNVPSDKPRLLYDETVVSGNLTASEDTGQDKIADMRTNGDVSIQKHLPLLSSTANKADIEQSLDENNESLDLNYETLISGNMLGTDNDRQTYFSSDLSDDVFTVATNDKPKLSSTAKFTNEFKQADSNKGKMTHSKNGGGSSDLNGDVLDLTESPPLLSSTQVTSETLENQDIIMAQLLHTKRTDDKDPIYSTTKAAENSQKEKITFVTKIAEPNKNNLQVDHKKNVSHTNKDGSFRNFIAGIQEFTDRPQSSSLDQTEHFQVNHVDTPFSKYSQINNKHVSKIKKGLFGNVIDHQRLQSEGFEVQMNSPGVTKSFKQRVTETKVSSVTEFDSPRQQNKNRQYEDTFEAGNKNIIMENNSPSFLPNNKRIEKANKSVTFSNTGSQLGKISTTSKGHFCEWSNDLNSLNSSLCKLETILDELDQEGSSQQTSVHQRRQHAIRRFRIWKGLRSQQAGLNGSVSGSLFDSSEILLTAESFGRRLSVESDKHPIDLPEGSRNHTTGLQKYKDVKNGNQAYATNSPTVSDIVFKALLTTPKYPDETLFGELSFQLERRVLAYVFSGHSHTLMHGYNLKNIELMIRTQKETLKESLQRRYEQIANVLHGYGWKRRVHAQFIYAMIHTYGTYQDVGRVRDLAKEKGWDNFSELRHHVLSIVPGVHRCNMIVVLDCLMHLVANDSKTIFLW